MLIATGGIYSEGDLTLTKTTVTANSAEAMGEGAFVVAVGGVWNAGDGGFTLIESEVSANTAISTGIGGVAAIGGIRNITPDVTGAGTLTLRKGTVRDNSASINGVGVGPLSLSTGFSPPASMSLDESSIRRNSADADAGAAGLAVGGILNGDPVFPTPTLTTLTESAVTMNQAEAGAVMATGGLHDTLVPAGDGFT